MSGFAPRPMSVMARHERGRHGTARGRESSETRYDGTERVWETGSPQVTAIEEPPPRENRKRGGIWERRQSDAQITSERSSSQDKSRRVSVQPPERDSRELAVPGLDTPGEDHELLAGDRGVSST